ncbi:Similar to Allergen Tha p 1 (Thaumetopoea pityocampa) [Cotesia congregata]|uniref:Similar to Allergen Tha p 1 (Thaumetopoea pityocampa) n=1 Tax=Cotesia congregata TaxID=51543 RepID=A0A8J2HS67_COTCN|nr:Similar to Allergen Tha p 1 (Thaumetopoea pityocampa) [Cotesia congregata]
MKLLVVFLSLIGLSVVSSGSSDYSQLPSNAEILKAMENSRIRQPIFKCLMGTGTCAGNGGKVKKFLLEDIKNNCNACTVSDKKRAVNLMKEIRSLYPVDWAKLVAKYDPHGVYERKLLAQIENQS